MSTVSSWLEKYPEQQIRKAINYTLNQLKTGKEIPNVGGYLQTMVKEENLIDPTEEEKKKRKAKEEKEKTRENLELEIEELKKELYNKEVEIIQNLFASDASIKEVAFKAAKESKYKSYDTALSDDENYDKRVSFRASVNNKVKVLFPNDFKKLQEKYDRKIESVKLKLSKI